MWLLKIDQSVTESLYSLSRSNELVQKIANGVGSFFVYLVPLALLIFFIRRNDRLLSIKILLTTIVTWKVLSNFVGTFIYNQIGFRDRPFASQGIQELFFEQPQKAFPSDHAAVLLVITLALFYFKKPTWGWIFLAGTFLSSLARVVVGFHWAGDILGGWLIGAIGFGLLVWLSPWLDKMLGRIKWLNQSDDQN